MEIDVSAEQTTSGAVGGWMPIETAPADMPGLFPAVVARFSEFDGVHELVWAHVAYRAFGGEWMVNTCGMKLHGNASFHLGPPTHWMRLTSSGSETAPSLNTTDGAASSPATDVQAPQGAPQ